MRRDTYTLAEAAKKLGVTVSRARQLVLDGTLKADKSGRVLVITAEALEKAKQRQTARGPEPQPKDVAEKKVAKKRIRKKDPTRLLKSLS